MIPLPSFVRALLALALAFSVAGCFQPLYGDPAVVGGSGIIDQMRSIEVAPVVTGVSRRLPRVGGEVHNELMYQLTGGGATNTTAYRLIVNIGGGSSQVIADVATGRSESQNFGLDASFSLVDISTGRGVLSGSTFSRVSYDTPGQLQRYAGERGLRDAENRAAKGIAASIRSRIASYFASGV